MYLCAKIMIRPQMLPAKLRLKSKGNCTVRTVRIYWLELTEVLHNF